MSSLLVVCPSQPPFSLLVPCGCAKSSKCGTQPTHHFSSPTPSIRQHATSSLPNRQWRGRILSSMEKQQQVLLFFYFCSCSIIGGIADTRPRGSSLCLTRSEKISTPDPMTELDHHPSQTLFLQHFIRDAGGYGGRQADHT